MPISRFHLRWNPGADLEISLTKIDKAYPSDFMQRGRVRVVLKKEDGTLYNPAISSTSTKQLMLHVAGLVPRHPGRTKTQEPPSMSGAGPRKSRKGGNTG